MLRERLLRMGAGHEADPGFAALKTRIIARTAHHYYADKDDLLFDRLTRRFRALELPDASAYQAVLDGPGGEAEWSALEAEITIGETFFFRYAEQFAALGQTILPELIREREAERRLRIWSAGCSTGAEAYSVAILIRDLLGPRLAEWDVGIVGTDISAAAIAAARAGEYGRWALRTMPQEDRLRWFRAIPPAPGPMRDGGYRLRQEYRAMVRYERQNLMGLIDGGLPETFSGFDLILCRNVLIYFSPDVVLKMVRGFGDRLRPGAWLLLGHAEPNTAYAAWLKPVRLPGTVAYRRAGETAIGPSIVIGEPIGSVSLDQDVAALQSDSHPADLPVSHDDSAEIKLPPMPHPVETPPSFAEPASDPVVGADLGTVGRIRHLADMGRTSEAWRELADALETDPADPVLRFYEGLLADSLGRTKLAEQALRGAVYLKRDFVMAHYQLGLMLMAQGRHAAGQRCLDNALRLSDGARPDTLLAEGDGMTAGELTAILRRCSVTRA